MKKMGTSKIGWTVFVLILIFFRFQTLQAQNELPDSQTQERLQAIQQMLVQGKPTADQWWYGWLIGYSAATVAQGAVYFMNDDKDVRQDMALGAATTFLGAMGQVIAPMVPGTAPNRLVEMPESTPEQRAKKLIEAEKLLEASARREKDGRSWKTHVLTGVVNLGSGLIVWQGFKRSAWEGMGNFVLNTVITEAQIWTQPTRAISDYNDYVQGAKSGEKQSCRKSEMSWSVAVSPAGFGICVRF